MSIPYVAITTHAPSASYSHGRWDRFYSRPGQHPSDALENWRAKVGAQVDWDSTSARLPGNKVVHTAIPYLSCMQCCPLNRHGQTLALRYTDPSQISAIIGPYVQEWVSTNPDLELIEYWPCQGNGVVSIMMCYRLNYLLISACSGEGSDVKTAKANAAHKLLESGHCMIYLPPRPQPSGRALRN